MLISYIPHSTNHNSYINLLQSYQKALKADPSYKPAAECLAVVLTDIGTSLKLAGNIEEGIEKYCEALKVDSHYAVISSSLPPFIFLVDVCTCVHRCTDLLVISTPSIVL